jgi:predicted SPOUT superfamily RNA methylase MTH1
LFCENQDLEQAIRAEQEKWYRTQFGSQLLVQFFITPSYLRSAWGLESIESQYAKKFPKTSGLPFLRDAKNSKYLEGYALWGEIAKPKKKQKGWKSKKQLQLESVTPYVNVDNRTIVE